MTFHRSNTNISNDYAAVLTCRLLNGDKCPNKMFITLYFILHFGTLLRPHNAFLRPETALESPVQLFYFVKRP